MFADVVNFACYQEGQGGGGGGMFTRNCSHIGLHFPSGMLLDVTNTNITEVVYIKL